MSQIEGKTILILGGAGQVGFEICKKSLEKNPAKIIVCGLEKSEVDEAVSKLKRLSVNCVIKGEWGNVFVREEIKEKKLKEISHQDELAEIVVKDVFPELDEKILSKSFLFKILEKHKPEIVIDAVNTATSLAYQDVYSHAFDESKEKWTHLLASLELPQLVRHTQILVQAFKRNPAEQFIKIGTGGTGGLGLTIPFTKGESEIPSRLVMSKAAVAGAQSMLLWVLGRTPNMPTVKEIKVTGLIGWKSIKKGKIITKKGTIELYDNKVDEALSIEKALKEHNAISLNKKLEGVWIETGENDAYTRDMFEALSDPELMGLITPFEVAEVVIKEIEGNDTGKEIIRALDRSTLGPTLKGRAMREIALSEMKKIEIEEIPSISTLGPLASKILFEAQILQMTVGLDKVTKSSPKEIEAKTLELIYNNKNLRSKIISVGIPVLLPSGNILRGPTIRIPLKSPKYTTVKDIENWASRGWVDLRAKNWLVWIKWMRNYENNHDREDLNKSRTVGKISGWIFAHELGGLRVKP